MSTQTYMGIPRELIPWFPKIDPDKCINDGVCIDFCDNGVFAQLDISTVVANPLNCVVGCSSCARVCPSDALSFPDNEEFVAILQQLREQHART